MRYALNDAEWRLICPILPCKQFGILSVDDRRVLNGIFSIAYAMDNHLYLVSRQGFSRMPKTA